MAMMPALPAPPCHASFRLAGLLKWHTRQEMWYGIEAVIGAGKEVTRVVWSVTRLA